MIVEDVIFRDTPRYTCTIHGDLLIPAPRHMCHFIRDADVCPDSFCVFFCGSCAGVHLATRGNELLRAKDLAGALAAYTKAISLDGSDAAFRSNRSVVYMSMGEHEKALLDAEVGTVSCLQEAYHVLL